MSEILAAGGRGYLMPTILFVVILYAARGLYGLHGRRSQQRKEFLELWTASRTQDDLWLVVAVRHLFGTFLPAPIIRLALRQADQGQALLELCELWSLFQFNRDSQQVRWLRWQHRTLKQRKLARAWFSVAYFLCALLAVVAVNLAAAYGPTVFGGWLYGIGAVVSGLVAFVCLTREDTMKIALRVGSEWVDRINNASQPPQTMRGDMT